MKQIIKVSKAFPILNFRKLYMGGGKNALAILLLLCFATNTAKSQQLIDTYFYPDDLKGYSTEAVPGTDDYVMAGTKYNGSDFNQIHFLYFQSTNMVVSKYYTLQTNAQNDIRVIDIVAADANTFYITCLYRDNFGAFSGLDRIKVLGVDASGSVILDENIGSVIGNNGHYDNIYPLHTIFLNGALFICGYVNDISSSYPYEPFYMGPVGGTAPDFRKAFVIKYDIAGGGTLAGKCWDYTVGGANRTDYDMAIRMVPLSNGDIYVTGSCNFSIVVSGTTYYPSATLSIMLDPTTLNTIYNNPFSLNGLAGSDPKYGEGEYGVGIIEDPATGDYFVIGNYFYSPDGLAQSMFYPRPTQYWFTYLDPTTFAPPYSSSLQPARLTCDWPNTWLLQNLPGNSSTDFLLAGMSMNNNSYYTNCSPSPTPSPDNENPFLALVSPSWGSPSISLSTTFQHVYLSNQGTGSETLDPNSYMRLGTGLSNVAWNPTFAARNDPNITTDITMSAPIWNNTISPEKLNFKLIRTDQNGDIPNPCDYYTSCAPTYHDEDAYPQFPNIITDDYYVSLSDDQDYDTDYPYHQMYECDGTYYRSANPSSSLNTHTTVSVKIFPNPAHDYVNISIIGLDKDKNANIELISITGAHIADLYNGIMDGQEDKRIKLPNLSFGLYYIRISSDGKIYSVQKLSIQ